MGWTPISSNLLKHVVKSVGKDTWCFNLPHLCDCFPKFAKGLPTTIPFRLKESETIVRRKVPTMINLINQILSSPIFRVKLVSEMVANLFLLIPHYLGKKAPPSNRGSKLSERARKFCINSVCPSNHSLVKKEV